MQIMIDTLLLQSILLKVLGKVATGQHEILRLQIHNYRVEKLESSTNHLGG